MIGEKFRMNKMREYWRAAKERFGILKAGSDIIKLLFDTSSTYWAARDLSEDLPEVHAKIPIEFDLSTTTDTLDCIKSFKERWMNNPKELEIGLNENHYFSNAKSDGKIVAILKTGINKVYIDDYGKVLSIPPKVAFAYHIYVAPEFRKLNISDAVFVKLMRELKDRGFKKVIGYYAPWNIRSMNLTTKIGFKKIAYIRYFKILGIIKFWFVKDLITGKKKLTFSISNLPIY
ncbi:MAG: GNAT family N-acetyltransferase [Syntrophaceae bacterium]